MTNTNNFTRPSTNHNNNYCICDAIKKSKEAKLILKLNNLAYEYARYNDIEKSSFFGLLSDEEQSMLNEISKEIKKIESSLEEEDVCIRDIEKDIEKYRSVKIITVSNADTKEGTYPSIFYTYYTNVNDDIDTKLIKMIFPNGNSETEVITAGNHKLEFNFYQFGTGRIESIKLLRHAIICALNKK